MQKASVSDLKNNLSAYLRKVRAGHPVVIYDRSVPIARLERIESTGNAADRLKMLKSQGVISGPSRPLSAKQLRARLQPLPEGARLLDALRIQRDADR